MSLLAWHSPASNSQASWTCCCELPPPLPDPLVLKTVLKQSTSSLGLSNALGICLSGSDSAKLVSCQAFKSFVLGGVQTDSSRCSLQGWWRDRQPPVGHPVGNVGPAGTRASKWLVPPQVAPCPACLQMRVCSILWQCCSLLQPALCSLYANVCAMICITRLCMTACFMLLVGQHHSGGDLHTCCLQCCSSCCFCRRIAAGSVVLNSGPHATGMRLIGWHQAKSSNS